VPPAEPVVSAWRDQFDSSAAQGMPAHITALYPFLPEDRLGTEALTRLRRLCARRPVLEVEFKRPARFPGVLYLEPEPSDGLRQLTIEIAGQWPEAPPYRGAFAEIIPHLTLAQGVAAAVLDMIEARVPRSLPIAASLVEAHLYVFDGERWRMRARLPFHPPPGR
jgi:2'-5' RNA ligase